MALIRRVSVFDVHDPTRIGALVPALERLGYHRYWTTEHHSPVQSGSPAVCVATAAALTRRIRVGAAGVMLRLRPPFAVAEEFRLLRALHGERIDLGVVTAIPREPMRSLLGGGAGGSGGGAVDDDLRDRLQRLVEHLDGRPVPAGPGPAPGARWSIWVCGTSPTTAQMAGELGLGFAYLDHPREPGRLDGPEVVAAYRGAFRPGPTGERPQVVVVCLGMCHPADAAAHWIPLLGLPPTFLGTAAQCVDVLAVTAERYGADELAIQCATRSLDVELAASAALAAQLGLGALAEERAADGAVECATAGAAECAVAGAAECAAEAHLAGRRAEALS